MAQCTAFGQVVHCAINSAGLMGTIHIRPKTVVRCIAPKPHEAICLICFWVSVVSLRPLGCGCYMLQGCIDLIDFFKVAYNHVT
jgi:hypothetical protein